METLARRTEPTDSPAATADAASCPSWVLLHRYNFGRVDTARTSAASHTSVGRPFRVSFGLTPPPAISSFFVDWAGSTQRDGDFVGAEHCIIAAHGDSVLLQISVPNNLHDARACSARVEFDYFVYEAGAARPPSLRLLPACFFPMQFERGESPAFRRPAGRPRVFLNMITGVLRRGEGGEILVAQLDLQPRQRDDSGGALPVAAVTAELCVLRGRGEWELLERVPIVVDDDELRKDDDLLWWWETDEVVPAGDRYLCFVDYFRGFLLYDTVAEEEEPGGPKLRYVPLPVAVPWGNPDQDDRGRRRMQSSRNLACAGAGDVRFVSVEPRCCCGGPGTSTCARSKSAFTVTTWTLSLAGGGPLAAAAWAKDGALDCEELWALLGDEGLPRGVRPEYPLVSSDDPDVVCFVVGRFFVLKDRRVWMVEVDTRRKTLRSVVPYTDEWEPYYRVPAKLQC